MTSHLPLVIAILVFATVAAPISAARGAETIAADIAIYGGTSGGVVAAVQAARLGKRAVILEPGKHLGGMTSGGLSAVDIGDPRTVGGLTREYFTRLAGQYGQKLPWDGMSQHAGPRGTGGAFVIEPHAAEELFDTFVSEAGGNVRVLRGARLASMKKDQARIVAAGLEDGRTVRASMWIDASYEGDLLAAAGVTTIVGREANALYGETLNGWRISLPPLTTFGPIGPNGRQKDGRGAWMRTIALDPFVIPGKPASGLLPLVSPNPMGTPGAAAPGVQAYCYRLCMTDDPANRLAVAPPENYEPRRYELHARYIAACRAAGDPLDMRWFCMPLALPHRKFDFNTAWLGANSPGLGWGWAEAGYADREKLAKAHENHQRGLLRFLATDPRVPQNVRDEFARFGLPKDEFKDTGGWPHQLYIREARRMVSDFVMTEHHAYGRQIAPQPVALASYGVDGHEAQRIEHGGILVDEGKLMGHKPIPGPYPIGYPALVPRAAECENVYSIFALSASHVCFASTRMEPVLMMLGQCAATAAALALDDSVSVQRVDYAKLRARLTADGQILGWPLAAPAGTAPPLPLAETIDLQGQNVALASPPRGLVVREKIGLVTVAALDGQVVYRARRGRLFETRAVKTPGGDFLLMFPEGEHYGASKGNKVNDLMAVRSGDGGKTWGTPTVAFEIPYNQHGFVPLTPRGTRRLYAFGTQPIAGKWSHEKGQQENAPIGFRHSDDDGRTWSDVTLIEPANDHDFKGMSVMRMTETDAGTWLIGAHVADWSDQPLTTRQYLLRSEDRGATWTLLPGKRPNGWFAPDFNRMDEGRPINLGGGKVFALFRTATGRLWSARSADDGKTWSAPAPTPLVHPDAPPMLFRLPDKRLIAFHHNRHAVTQYTGLTGNMPGMRDRSELWFSISADGGETWGEPRFFLANAAAANLTQAFYNYQCSYMDAFLDGNTLHCFLPHRWQQALHLRVNVADLAAMPTRVDLGLGEAAPTAQAKERQ